jgi:hypothetical protein
MVDVPGDDGGEDEDRDDAPVTDVSVAPAGRLSYVHLR